MAITSGPSLMLSHPSSRKIHLNYNASNTVDAALNRLYMYEADSSGSPGTDLTGYSYNGTGRLVFMVYQVPSIQGSSLNIDGAGVTVYNGFDRFGRETVKDWREYLTYGLLDRFQYTYDYAGNRTLRDVLSNFINGSYPNVQDQQYSYDGLLRLKDYDQGTWNGSAITSSNKQRSWKLDQLGNWAQTYSDLSQTTSEQTRTHNAANELTAIDFSSTHVAEDAAGNMTKVPKPTSWSAHFDLKYDAWNRLVEVKDGSTTVQTNEYDGLGRRIQKVAGSDTHDYYYNENWQLLEERKNADADPLNQYLWHPYYVDALAIRWYDDNTDGSGVAEYYYLHDANFNVTAVNDSSGAVVERCKYSPYGEVTFLNADFTNKTTQASDIGSTHFYTGRELDPESGLQLNRYRHYAGHVGRWLARDPVEYEFDRLNLLEYASSDPSLVLDPLGQLPINPPIPPSPQPPPPPNIQSEDCHRDDIIRCKFELKAPLCRFVKCPPGYQCLTWRLGQTFQVACVKCSGSCTCERGDKFECSPINAFDGRGRPVIACDCNTKRIIQPNAGIRGDHVVVTRSGVTSIIPGWGRLPCE